MDVIALLTKLANELHKAIAIAECEKADRRNILQFVKNDYKNIPPALNAVLAGTVGEELQENNSGGICNFTEKELLKMPKKYRPDFKVGKIKAHIRLKDNGVYEVRCQVNKRSIYGSGKVLDEAKEKFIECLKAAESGENTVKVKKSVALGEYMKIWLETVKKPYVKENTYHDYCYYWQYQICPKFGIRAMSSISQFEWQEFINSYNSRGRHRTARKLYQLLSACYDFAVGDEVLVKNPFLKVKLGEYEKKHGDPLTLEEEKALVAALLEFGDLYSQAFVFLVYTGLRRSELASVSVADGWVYVKTSKVRKGRAEKPRCLPVSPMLSALLSHIDVQAIKEINPNVLTKNFKKRFPAHHLHDTRHTFITRCQECGIQRELVSLWAGHAPDSSITSTVYTHLEKNKQHQVEEMSKFSYTL